MLLYLWTGTKIPFLYAAFLSACFKIESDFHHGLVPHAQGNSSLCNPQRILLSEILPVSGLFMISFTRIWQDDEYNLSPKDRFPKVKPPKGKKKGDKTPCDSSSTASRLLTFTGTLAAQTSKSILSHLPALITSSSCPFPARRDLLTRNIWLLPVTGPLSAPPPSSGKNGFAIARKMAALPVIVNVIIPSRIVTGDGTPIGNVISSVTTSTCMWPPIPIVTFLYSLF